MRSAVTLAIALAALTACPYGGPHRDETQNAPSKSSTTPDNPRKPAGESHPQMNPIAPPQSAAASAETQVELSEYEIRMPQTLTAGHQTFRIVNAGKENHNFEVTGNGVSAKLPNDLTRGDTTEIGMDLKPGTYTIFCPVDGHRGKGMQTTVTVK